MKKKNLFVLGLATLFSVVACNGGNRTDVDQTLPEDDPTSEVKFEFWHCLGHEKTTNLTKIVNAFNAKYDGKYEVVLKHPAGDYGDLHDVVKTKISSGEVPALTMGYPDSFSEYMTANIGNSHLLRLTNFINDEKFGYTQKEIEDFIPGYYNEGTQYQFDGTWSMPMYKSTEILYYNYSYFMGVNDANKAKFANNAAFMTLYNGIDGARATDAELQELRTWVEEHDGYYYDVPETWDQAITLARKMVADRKAAGVTSEFYPFGYDSDSNLMISQMAQRDIPYTQKAEAKRDRFLFNNDKAKTFVNEIVTYLKEKIMITKGSLGGKAYTNEYFNAEKCAFTVGSTGGSSYNISSNFVVKLAPVPYKGVRKYIQQGPSICFFDNANPYIHKGAWLFYKALSDSEGNASLALENSYDPVKYSCYETDAYKQWIAPENKGLKYEIPRMTQELKPYYMTSPVFIGSSTARDEIGDIISHVYAGWNIDEAFDTAIDNCITAAK